MDKATVKSIIDGLEKNSKKQVEINVVAGRFEMIDPATIDYVGTETLTFPTKFKGKVFIDIPSITHICVSNRAEEKMSEKASDKCDRITERPERREIMGKEVKMAEKKDDSSIDF